MGRMIGKTAPSLNWRRTAPPYQAQTLILNDEGVNEMKKRFLSMLLCLVMVMALLPTAVFAGDGITEVNDADEFATAIANGGSIRLMSNFNLQNRYYELTGTVTLDLNSFTIEDFQIKVAKGGNQIGRASCRERV